MKRIRFLSRWVYVVVSMACVVLVAWLVLPMFNKTPLTTVQPPNQQDTASQSVVITKEYVQQNAQIGLTETEIEQRFGKQHISGRPDNTDMWLFDKTKVGSSYTPTLNVVAFDEIKKGDVEYQLYINLRDKKACMYSYFYRGTNNQVWEYEINPDGTKMEMQVSN